MGAFRRHIALISVLWLGALAAACGSAGGPGGVAGNDAPLGSQTRAEQIDATPANGAAGVHDAPAESTEALNTSAGSASDTNDQAPLASELSAGSNPADLAVSVEILEADLPPVTAPRLFGPQDGGIYHDPSNTASMRTFVSAATADLVLSANISNPFDPARRPYDHGFLFRVSTGRFHAVVLASDGTWRHYVSNGRKLTVKESGPAEMANLARGESNSLALVAAGRDGWLFINGHFVASLDLSDYLSAGDAGLVANLVSKVDVLGAQTTYEALTVGGVEPIEAAVSGMLLHGQSGDATGESIPAADSLMVEVDFAVPHRASEGDWSFGFVLAGTDGSTRQFSFNDRALWRLVSASPDEDAVVELGPTYDASIEPGTSNRLSLVHLHGEWSIFLNGEFVTHVAIPDEAVPVTFALVAGVERGEQAPGSESEYSNFRAFALGN